MTKDLNLDNNRTRMWNLIRALNREPNSCSPPSLETESENFFMVQFSNIGNIVIDKFAAQKVRIEINTLAGKQHEPEDNVINDLLRKEELEDAVKDLKTKPPPPPRT